MSLMDRLVDGVRATMKMRGDLDRLTAQLDKAVDQLFDHEKRLVRIETMIEMSRAAPPPDAPRLPGCRGAALRTAVPPPRRRS